MSEQAQRDLLHSICQALEAGNAEPLLVALSDTADWSVDWKGEGVFGGGPLFGRRRCRGRAETAAFFADLFRHLTVESFLPRQVVCDGHETITLGRAQWRPAAGGDSFESDWTLRLVFRGTQITKGRLLTLPKNHIETFIEDDENRRRYSDPKAIHEVIQRFQKLYFDAYLFGKTWGETYWLGTPVFKCPLDLWIYQEIIAEQKPDWIIETGTCYGGSAHYLASMCDLVGKGNVLSVDVTDHYNQGQRPQHPRITYLLGSSVSDEILHQIQAKVGDHSTNLVILDADHRRDHVIQELRRYHPFVNPGGYLIVEDSNLNGHPTKQNYGPGPWEAVEEFLAENSDFEVDLEMEKFLMTSNPRGFLRRVR